MNRILQRFLRYFFKHLYTTLAWAYDFVAFASSIGQWSNWQRVGIELLPQGRILEIGFGTGRVFSTLSSEKRDIYGIDLSSQMAQITSRRLRANNLAVTLCRAKAQALPFPRETFHSLLATFPSEYIFQEESFKEAWRVLKPEGIFIIIPGVSKIIGWKGRKTLLGLLDEFASFLYRLTGEAVDASDEWVENVQNRMAQIGFIVEIELVQQERAVVYRLIARKQTSPG